MFRRVIQETPFVGQDADRVFGSIYGDTIDEDVTFLSTLRALCSPRIKKDDSLRFSYFTVSTATMIKAHARRCDSVDSGFLLVNVMAGIDNLDGAKSEMITRIEESGEWTRADRAEKWLTSQKVDSVIFYSESRKSVFFVVFSAGMRELHLVQATIPAIMPWFFSENPLTDEEKEFIVTFGKRSADEYIEKVTKLSKKYNFREIKIRRLLEGFEKVHDERALANVKEKIARTRTELETLQNQIAEALDRLRGSQALELGLETRIARDDGEHQIMDYFMSSQAVEVVDSYGENLDFIVKGVLETFNPECAESMINEGRGGFCRSFREDIRGDVVRVMKAVFVDQEIKLQVCAAYRFEGTRRVYALSEYSYPIEYENYLPNPHIHHYSCMGDYVRYITDYLIAGNYIPAIEQAVVSGKSLNWNDGVVISAFGGDVNGYWATKKCYVLSDGSVVTGKEAAEWLKKQEEDE